MIEIGSIEFRHKYFDELKSCILTVSGLSVVSIGCAKSKFVIPVFFTDYTRLFVISKLKDVQIKGTVSEGANSIYLIDPTKNITMSISSIHSIVSSIPTPSNDKAPKYLLQFFVNKTVVRTNISEKDLNTLVRYLENIPISSS